MKTMWIKEWFFDKIQDTASRYNCYIDYAERTDDELRMGKVVDGYVSVVVEEISESEKAIQVVLATGEMVGSYKGWKTWIPKSVIRA